MIHIEILSSSDPLAVGLYEFEFDHILIGRSKKNDLIFLDKELPLSYMILQIAQDHKQTHLVIRSLTRSPFFFVNGKKISGALKVRPNDEIAFGENKIRILRYERTRNDADLSAAYAKFEENASDLRFALEFIEEVLVENEEKAHHV